MTPDVLFKSLAELADGVFRDPRWRDAGDELGIQVFTMLTYGFALAQGRFVLLLDQEDIDAAVIRCLVEKSGKSLEYAIDIVDEARRSAFDKHCHHGHYELIGVGHQYWWANGSVKFRVVIDNVFENIDSVRRRSESKH
jgi:hypothetical protein